MAKLLIVDDMDIFREPIAAALEREGYDTVCATNGIEALDLLGSHRPDLVLLDIAMPCMDGLTCLENIRRQPALAGLPVIMLTAMSERETLSEAQRIGVEGYLLKSQFSLDELTRVIREALVTKDDARTTGATSPAPKETFGPAGRNGAPSPSEHPAPPDASRDSASASASQPAFNLDSLRQRWGADRAFVARLISKFRALAPGEVDALGAGVDAGDVEAVARLAHALKGAAGYAGAETLCGLAADLEAKGRTGDLQGAAQDVDALRLAMKACLAFEHETLNVVAPSAAGTAATGRRE